MLRTRGMRTLATVMSLALVPLAARPLLAGPPWISIELPGSPYDQTTRGSYLLVHAFHHGTPVNFPVTGTAEGIVNGERRTVKLSFTTTGREGVYALRQQWPSEGTWTLFITVSQAPGDGASALVDIAPSGEVTSVRVPTYRQGATELPRKVNMAEVDSSLAARARARQVAGSTRR